MMMHFCNLIQIKLIKDCFVLSIFCDADIGFI